MSRDRILAGFTLVLGLALTGCATTEGTGPSSAAKTAGAGALLGAGLGAIVGHQSGDTAKGAAVGAAVGGAGGYVVGNEKDKSATRTQTQAAQSQASAAYEQATTVVINVTNSNGSITPVTLRKQGNIYVGPKGEQYTTLPTEDNLRSVYGF